MKLHANAALSLRQRHRMVRLVCEDGWSVQAAAAEFKTSSKTCSKWVARFREASESGLRDRSSACVRVANRTDERRVAVIAGLRRLRFTGPEIADVLEMPVSTVSGILSRIGMGKLGRLGIEPACRYERDRPGELVHIDVKKLGRIYRAAIAPTITSANARRSVGITCTSPSTTRHAWLTPKCSLTKAPPRPWAS
jgi:transposase